MNAAPDARSPDHRIRVVVDGQSLTDASAYRGIGTYSRRVLAGLAADPQLEVTVLSPTSVEVPQPSHRVATRRAAPPRWRAIEHELRLPLDLRRCAGDVVFTPAPPPAPRRGRPAVGTLFDVLPLVDDDPGFAVERRRWHRWAPRWRRLDAVIAISAHTATQGIDVLGLDPRRVHVAHLGVDRRFHPGANTIEDPPFVLYVGEYGPHKGFAEAFATIGRIADRGLPHRLLVAGRVAPWFAPTVEGLQAAAPRPDRIAVLGFVDDLPELYRRAQALIVTSRHEGFGLPALEAMASGTPVIAFDNSATSEVVGGAGTLVPDGDVDALAEALASVLTDGSEADRVVRGGLAAAARFSWEACVQRHVDVLRSVV